ncbi:MAG: hypothetical protein CSA20_09670 [Deltaproteobacteria bacterium]|nr:MAG: hypothetical protein CSA20_09670 [Deltaproteobacteria bacterium]
MESYANSSQRGETIYSRFGRFVCGLFLAYVGGALVVVLFSLPDLSLPATFNEFFKDVFGCFFMLLFVNLVVAFAFPFSLIGELLGLFYLLSGKKWLLYLSLGIVFFKSVFLTIGIGGMSSV